MMPSIVEAEKGLSGIPRMQQNSEVRRLGGITSIAKAWTVSLTEVPI